MKPAITSTVSPAISTITMVSSNRSKPWRKAMNVKLFHGEGSDPIGRPCIDSSRRFAECQGLVDCFFAARNLLGEFLVNVGAGLDEGVLVGLVDLHSRLLELLEQI